MPTLSIAATLSVVLWLFMLLDGELHALRINAPCRHIKQIMILRNLCRLLILRLIGISHKSNLQAGNKLYNSKICFINTEEINVYPLCVFYIRNYLDFYLGQSFSCSALPIFKVRAEITKLKDIGALPTIDRPSLY